jgi:hypothetical protein
MASVSNVEHKEWMDGRGKTIQRKERRRKEKKKTSFHNFINPFIAFATAKLDLAIICLDSFVTSGIA